MAGNGITNLLLIVRELGSQHVLRSVISLRKRHLKRFDLSGVVVIEHHHCHLLLRLLCPLRLLRLFHVSSSS